MAQASALGIHASRCCTRYLRDDTYSQYASNDNKGVRSQTRINVSEDAATTMQ